MKFKELIEIEDECLCIVMEYADGGDLKNKISECSTFISER